MSFAETYFIRDIEHHVMQVLRDESVYRHLRFKRPDTMCMSFDIVTWPGNLCYTGDMGTFVFRRLFDMFDFFRRPKKRAKYSFDLRYWAEKLEAVDKTDGFEKFSPEVFRKEVADYFEQETQEYHPDRKKEIWAEIERDVLDQEEEGPAFAALWSFIYEGFVFSDWESPCRQYSHRFLWCCHALEWAIDLYDNNKSHT